MKKKTLIIGMLLSSFALALPQSNLDDTQIGDAIENEYRFDHAVNSNRIDIVVTDGIVELTGDVDNLKARERATNIAELVKGVRSVSNRIAVEPPSHMTDAGIKYNVETVARGIRATAIGPRNQ